MASILTLNDDCLWRIISFLDDLPSFHSVVLSCKRVQQVINNTRSILHPRLLRAKAEYYMKQHLVEITDGKKNYKNFCKLRDFLSNAARLSAAKELLTYAKVVNVWERNGPVVAKLFTWIRKLESSTEEGEPRATCFKEYRSVTLHLPVCDKDLKIDTTYFRDYIGNYDIELSIRVTCGDLDVKSKGFTHYCPDDYQYWAEKEVHAAIKPMKPVVELLQKELGGTVPPLTDLFFIWLCYFFPHEENLAVEHKLLFKDPSRNEKPTPGHVQPAIAMFHQYLQPEAKLKNLVSEWNNPQSNLPCLFAETMAVLIQRSEITFLEKLQKDANGFYEIVSVLKRTPSLPKPLVLDLLARTTLEFNDYNPGSVADKFVESRASFRLSEGKVVKAWGGMHGDGASYPTWDELELKVTLPDGKELKLDTDCSYRRKPLQIEKLSPVTELFQQGVSKCMEGEKHIPKLCDRFTACYLLHALSFGGEEETFLGSDDDLNLSPTQFSEQVSSDESEEEQNVEQ